MNCRHSILLCSTGFARYGYGVRGAFAVSQHETQGKSQRGRSQQALQRCLIGGEPVVEQRAHLLSDVYLLTPGVNRDAPRNFHFQVRSCYHLHPEAGDRSIPVCQPVLRMIFRYKISLFLLKFIHPEHHAVGVVQPLERIQFLQAGRAGLKGTHTRLSWGRALD